MDIKGQSMQVVQAVLAVSHRDGHKLDIRGKSYNAYRIYHGTRQATLTGYTWPWCTRNVRHAVIRYVP